MIAIQLSEKNSFKIHLESPIDRRDLDALMWRYADPMGETYYFIPQFNTDELTRTSWHVLSEPYFWSHYNADPRKIETEFVEIKPL